MITNSALGIAVNFGYSNQFGDLRDKVDDFVRRLWLELIGAGCFFQSALLDIIMFSWYEFKFFTKKRSKINAEHSMDSFHTKFNKVLFVCIIAKNIFYIIMYIIGAVFYLPGITNIPLAVIVVIAIVIFIGQLMLFGYMSLKVGSLLNENPILKLVRAKVLYTNSYITHFRFLQQWYSF